jgi:hypothetical protein
MGRTQASAKLSNMFSFPVIATTRARDQVDECGLGAPFD